jgi:hypothetical protein
MKRFKVVNQKIKYMDDFGNRKYDTIYVTLYQPPYEDENILHKTKWNEKDVTITEMKINIEEEE